MNHSEQFLSIHCTHKNNNNYCPPSKIYSTTVCTIMINIAIFVWTSRKN